MYRRNAYDPAAGVLSVQPVRARAFQVCLAHYWDVFMKGDTGFSIPPGTVSNPERMKQFAAFIFWTW